MYILTCSAYINFDFFRSTKSKDKDNQSGSTCKSIPLYFYTSITLLYCWYLIEK